MVRIRATCPQCDQDVELTSQDVTALVCADTGDGSYAFRCPECEIAVSVEADLRIVDLLVDRGVTKRIWSLPAELAEYHSGPRLQYDDLLDLHVALQRDGWFREVENMVLASMVPAEELALFLATHPGTPGAAEIAQRFAVPLSMAEQALAAITHEHEQTATDAPSV